MKRALIAALTACGFFSTALPAADKQSAKWPVKPVRLIIASSAGSGDDYVARAVMPKVSELLGQPIIIDNRGAGGGLIGQTLAQKAPADGYTFLLAGGSMAGARYANALATYDVLNDFTPVSLIETSPFVLVIYPGVTAKNLAEYVALGQSGKLKYGTAGPGQMPYWSAQLFNRMAGIRADEVRYSAIPAIALDVISNRIDYFFAPSSVAKEQPRLRALAVTTSTRSAAFPDVPTVAETLPGYDMPAWRSIMGPAHVRRDIVDALNAAIVRALEMPDVRKQLLFVGSQPSPSTPEELSKRYAYWIERFGMIAKQADLKPQ